MILLQRAGVIKDLQRQVKFVLIPTQRINGRLAEKECSYKADFVYWENVKDDLWVKVVEDVKGCKTEVYRIKKKLMLKEHGVIIRET